MEYTLKKLPDICRISTGKHDANHATSNGMYRFYTCANQYCYCNTKSFSGEAVIVPGNGDIGLVFYYNGDFDAYQRTYVLTDISIYAKYLYYHMLYKWRHVNSGKQFGSTVKYVRMGNFSSYELPVPPLPEQERIVAKIEELFSQLDAAVAELKSVKEKLAIYRQAVLEDSFKGKYPLKRLEEISKAISGYAFKSSLYSPTGKYTIVKIGNVKSFSLDFSRDLSRTDEDSGKTFTDIQLRKGDCLITMTGSRGKRDYGFVAMIEEQENFVLNQRVALLRFQQKYAIPKFYQYYLSSHSFRDIFFSYETGNVGQGNVGIKALREPLVILPTLEQQNNIVESIEQKLSVCNNIEQTVDTALQRAAALRQSILKQAFEGKL